MRNQINCLVIVFCLLQLACERQKKSLDSFGFKAAEVVKAKGHKIPTEKTALPKIIPVSGVKKILAGKPDIIPLRSNVFPAQPVSVIQVTTPPAIAQGKNYQLPITVRAKDSPFLAGVPEIVVVNKDFYNKDEDPESFSSMSVAHGLKYAEVNALMQDRAGNIWIATWDGGGVSKYDGRTLTNYSVAQGLSSEHAFSLLEDRSGNIWIGTDHSSVNKFDGKFITRYNIGFGMSNNFVLDMMQDRNGNIWFATPNGVIRYDGNFFSHYTTSQGLPNNGNSCLFEDSKGNVWVGTDGGICKFDGHVFQNYNGVFGIPQNVETSTQIKSIMEDKSENFWIATNNDGLYKYDGKRTSHFTIRSGLSSNFISQLAEDRKGIIWIATYDSGLNKFDGKSFTHYNIRQGLTSENIFCLLIDKSGTLWLGTGAGINRYKGKLFTHIQAIQGPNKEPINCINADKNKNIWIGTGRTSLTKYDGRSLTRFTPRQGLKPDPIVDILEDRSGNIWMATWMGGLNKFDGRSFTFYTTNNGLIDNEVIDILEDKKGNLWIGTNGGVSKFDGKYFTNFSTTNGLISDDINSVFEDHQGNLWFGTRDHGLSEFDGTSFINYNITHGLGNAAITSITEDRKNNLWLGTNDGLIKFDGKYFIHYTSDQGLKGNIVTNVLESNNGDIWIGTNNGLNRLQAAASERLDTEKVFSLFKKYTSSEGFLGVWSYYKTMMQDTSGDIWIGAYDRLTTYHPEGDIPDTIPLTIQLSGVALFDENINWHDLEKKKDSTVILSNGVKLKNFNFTGVTQWYNQPENLQLRYDNNYITFQFIGITVNRPKEVRYKYILQGLDKHWSAVTDKSEASYNNLSSGKYIFKVKAANSEGYWSDELNYSFSILPPWWQTRWAYSSYMIVFLVGLMVFIKWRERTLRKEKLLLEEKVNVRTHELQKEKEKVESTLAELEAAQEQLIEAEKRASVEKLQKAVLNERLRISQELHDEVGATLSSISIFSQAAIQKNESGNMSDSKNILEKIGKTSREVMSELNDAVWLINPLNDNLHKIVQRINNYALPLCRTSDIRFEIKNALTENPALGIEKRKAVYLILKEAVNNSLKYSSAKNLVIRFEKNCESLHISIKDDGKGFAENNSSAGNGFNNMKQRAKDMNGKIDINSMPQKGTEIILEVPLTNIGD